MPSADGSCAKPFRNPATTIPSVTRITISRIRRARNDNRLGGRCLCAEGGRGGTGRSLGGTARRPVRGMTRTVRARPA